ncbi:NADH:ubiquinone oxidoreductase 24 kD subunit [Anaerolinea thermolimosa]|uniref:NADH-quinone oxidoreductase subunit NuoE n=1 Tax=Anaerolinea thermolimosa TaxID=229919 RepID=UPI00078508F2|nr:NADH-quinone oxidoreductase subunit NuoE [Anaerolinea thermolimosa]GAP06563.1 NADH:ubiquinone oxidoreductase 24 kD subunit [Anaerolinea thermolimosa]
MSDLIVLKESINELVKNVVEKHGASRAELIPILNEINRKMGYLPSYALEEVARLTQIPKSQVFSVATFYQMLSTDEMGEHVIRFCESAPCHVVGGRQVWQRLQEELHLQPGQTSPDGKWTLVTVSCLGVCGVGPVLIVDDDMYGNVTPDMIPEILARYA